MNNFIPHFLLCLLSMTALAQTGYNPQYPMKRPPRATPAPAESFYTVHPDQPRQVIEGLGFEIQSDSIGSGNNGLPEARTSVPHDLTPSERKRFSEEMLKGFRYCRLAGGLYWRGLDSEGKTLRPRWDTQLAELREMLDSAGVEGVSLEYWSPPPYWKACGEYVSADVKRNLLKPFGPEWASDPDYHGDTARFFADFAQARVADIKTLEDAGIRVCFWGLQNEPRPWHGGSDYSRCGYTVGQYDTAFRAAAPAIRSHNPKIRIIADTWELKNIRPVMDDPEARKLPDALVIHHVGSDSAVVKDHVEAVRARFGNDKPLFQNEYEYGTATTSPDRCLNTVTHIMNWFQIGEAPTWFWLHALKPIHNSEAGGYSLGFWRPATDDPAKDHPAFPGLKPGEWVWNKYNWHAVAGFLRHMPWNSRGIAITEKNYDSDLRPMAFKRPDGKLVLVVANRSAAEHTFRMDTGLPAGTVFRGFRHTPDNAGPDFRGVPIGTATGPELALKVPDRAWEFWVQE
jgi:hypothetical protein